LCPFAFFAAILSFGFIPIPNTMHTVHVNLGPRSYDIAVVSGDPTGFVPFVRQQMPKFQQALVVADSNSKPHGEALAQQLGCAVALIPAGEASKCLEQTAALYAKLYEAAADRKTPVIAVGGGVVGDLAGFVAATYNRGLPLLMVPTTLLAMVDSSVGGKVGINLPQGKNLVGAFHQPAGVWIDTAFLDTLPDREYRSGLAEVVKYGVILDAEFFTWLEGNVEAILRREPGAVRQVVARSCRLKADVVEQDEREETGLRMALNYGHTFAHAFEAIGGYGTWLHGEAVAAGMVCASKLAEMRVLIPNELTTRQVRLLEQFTLPIQHKAEWDIEAMLAVMRRDKKNVGGKMRFILPTKLGQVTAFDDIPERQVRAILENA
jgi:3-dehydroquinate synthase